MTPSEDPPSGPNGSQTPRGPSKYFGLRRWLPALILLAIGIVIGRFLLGGSDTASDHGAYTDTAAIEKAMVYTCSMHPQIRMTDPNAKCPICAMDLIPVKEDGAGDSNPRTLTMSREAEKLAEVQTQPVERRFAEMEIPLVGKVDFDETRVKTISAWVPGRLDRLFVDYTGVPVQPGDHLVEMYSPDLYAAQEELIQALRTQKNVANSDSEFVKRTALTTVEAAREKLQLLGFTDRQVAEIEKLDAPKARVEIKSPMGGIVIEKNANEGMYVQTGTPIYTVADLSRVWVRLDAYESDLHWIRYGQEVEIRTEAYGDKVFLGSISFIDPVLDPMTRTVKIRVIVENATGELRPNMFVRATVKARAAEQDHVLSRNLEGKWICPMHPEVIKDENLPCDECGMDLLRAEDLGYVSSGEAEPPLIVPVSAVLTTGKRAIVYVRVPGKEKPTFEGVEIEIGARAGDHYIVRKGLMEGQEVVTQGNFKIDSALQILARPSMMSAEAPAAPSRLEVPGAFRESLALLFTHYLEVQQALGGDDPSAAQQAGGKLEKAMEAMDTGSINDEARSVYTEYEASLKSAARNVAKLGDLQQQRERFVTLSRAMEGLVRRFGPLPHRPVRRFFCPMAFDNRGGYWLQEDETVLNPYFGAAMLRCGEMKEVLSMPDHDGGESHGH